MIVFTLRNFVFVCSQMIIKDATKSLHRHFFKRKILGEATIKETKDESAVPLGRLTLSE